MSITELDKCCTEEESTFKIKVDESKLSQQLMDDLILFEDKPDHWEDNVLISEDYRLFKAIHGTNLLQFKEIF